MERSAGDREVSLIARAVAIAGDRDRGAAELLSELLPLLTDAVAEGREATAAVARVVCRGQPAMVSLWHACAAAVADHSSPGRFSRARAEMERAPVALTKAAARALRDLLSVPPSGALLTLSYSSSVARAIGSYVRGDVASGTALGAIDLEVVCGEGRPRFEGRRMARELAAAGARVTLVTDAALTDRLDRAAAVIVGADGISGAHWINKVGTRGLASAAFLAGVPIYVVAARNKAQPEQFPAIHQTRNDPAEVWPDPAHGIVVANPYFEATPLELATLILTEVGPIAPADAATLADRWTADFSHLFRMLQTS